MNRLIGFLITVFALAIFAGCADKPPSVRVQNQRANKANVQFKQSNTNTININGVDPGAVSNYQDVVTGIIDVKATMDSEPDQAEKRFVATDNNNYTIVILADVPPTIRIDEQSK